MTAKMLMVLGFNGLSSIMYLRVYSSSNTTFDPEVYINPFYKYVIHSYKRPFGSPMNAVLLIGHSSFIPLDKALQLTLWPILYDPNNEYLKALMKGRHTLPALGLHSLLGW